jgi:hypothetical protein
MWSSSQFQVLRTDQPVPVGTRQSIAGWPPSTCPSALDDTAFMTAEYRLDLEYRTSVNNRLRELAEQLIGGEISVIAASRAMHPLQLFVEGIWPDMSDSLLVFVGIDSETDTLPIGSVRDMWHPSTAELEDRKEAEAERADRACYRILTLLGSETAVSPNE